MKYNDPLLFLSMLGVAFVLTSVIFALAWIVVQIVGNYGLGWIVGGVFTAGCMMIAAAFALDRN